MDAKARVRMNVISKVGTSLALLVSTWTAVGCGPTPDSETAAGDGPIHVRAPSAVEAGRYLALVAGCNDCHTDGYLFAEGDVPEADWLAGSALGFRGPWGTTYPSNLRLLVQEISEDEWTTILHTRTALPPMPWMNVNQMSEQDARAIYRYLVDKGPAGERAPGPVPPGVEPETPYISLEPQNLPDMPQL